MSFLGHFSCHTNVNHCTTISGGFAAPVDQQFLWLFVTHKSKIHRKIDVWAGRAAPFVSTPWNFSWVVAALWRPLLDDSFAKKLRSGCQVPNFVPWSVLFNYLVTDISKIEIVFGTWQTCFSSGKIYFEGRTVSFREGICLYRLPSVTYWPYGSPS